MGTNRTICENEPKLKGGRKGPGRRQEVGYIGFVFASPVTEKP
jgi:hypothetical protein